MSYNIDVLSREVKSIQLLTMYLYLHFGIYLYRFLREGDASGGKGII
jgi:hypothetical protein